MAEKPVARRDGRPKAVRIILVEDNPGDVYLVEKALKQRRIKYKLSCYSDGEEAMNALSAETRSAPDLILLDLNLPRKDGVEVLKSIRGFPWLVGVPVGILTSSEALSDRHRVSLLGATRYIHKPHELDAFLQEVGTAIVELLTKKSSTL